ncbi:BAI1-associated protein 3 [Trichonephila clavata]|uniref:BAI1-associated protein 3 n=1 Tax=Trichonephila clavata TaxID=2740835 RepID=A0A8X6HL25_TRICU|nr:BAI1-associated protein 3 [Trichonephila clavata]
MNLLLEKTSNLPAKILSIKGAVVQVLVLNQDKSYSAEAVLLLKQVQNMSGFASLEFLPVYLMALKKFDMSQISYQVLKNRSRWDKNAKLFINSRNKAVKNQKISLSCIPGKNPCLF